MSVVIGILDLCTDCDSDLALFLLLYDLIWIVRLKPIAIVIVGAGVM